MGPTINDYSVCGLVWPMTVEKISGTVTSQKFKRPSIKGCISGEYIQIYGSNVWLWNSFTNQMNIGRINMQGNNLCIYSSTDASSLLFREQVPKFRSTHLAFSKTKRKITNILKIQIWLKVKCWKLEVYYFASQLRVRSFNFGKF